MSLRVRTILLIVVIVLATTVTTFLTSMYFTTQSLEKTIEQDLSFAIGITNSLVGTEMDLIKSEAIVISEQLAVADDNETLQALMSQQLAAHQEASSVGDTKVTALSVFDRNGTIISCSEPPHEHDVDTGDYIDLVYNGSTIISSPFYCSTAGEYVMNVYTPLVGERVLAVTIPGERFSDLLSEHRLWQTGDIFMLNAEGMFIGAADDEIVQAVNDYTSGIRDSDDPDVHTMVDLVQTILSEDSGVTNYTYQGSERICAYSRITSSALGWRVAVTVPVSESPRSDALEAHIYVAILFLIVGTAAAVFIARLVSQPFDRIEKQNQDLETLNTTIQEQSKKIMEEKERIAVMLDATPLACRLWNHNYELIACNDAAVKLFNLKDKQDYIDNYYHLFPELQPDGQNSREKLIEMLTQAFEKGSCVHDFEYRLDDGTAVPTEVVLVCVPYEGDYAVASYSRDLRDQKAMLAEIEDKSVQLKEALFAAEEANNAKTDFLAHMSHEIRTPLNAVIGLSELSLAEDQMQPVTAANLEKIYGAGSTILSIVNDILDISKIESGKFETNLIQYDTPSLINDTVTLNIVRIGEKPIEFNLRVDENLPASLYGDDLRVKQIFSNLLSNAFKYTNSGTVEWKIASEREGNDIYIVSSISDTGIGIRPDDMQNLFKAYSQVDMKTNRRIEGTGLGLAIARSLAAMMDGSITAESEYGEGTTFHVRLRQSYVSDKTIGKEVADNLMSLRYAISKRSSNKLMTRVDLSYARVLVVDDISTNLDVARGMLRPYKMKIDCVMSGPEAIELIRSGKHHYDAIFMDHMMPGMDGIEATRIIREDLGTDYGRNIPIFALTANAIAGNEEMFLAHGFQAFISKPIDIMKLDSILRKWVRNKDLEKKLVTNDVAVVNQSVSNDMSFEQVDSFGQVDIPGLDVQEGLRRFDGNADVYTEVLRSYAKNSKQLLVKLDELLKSGNLEQYGITIHGIKGSSLGICANDAGEAALELEQLSKAKDLEAVTAKHPIFMAEMSDLLSGLQAFLDTRKLPKTAHIDKAVLQELKDACRAYDMNAVDAAMQKLESYEYEGESELVAWLREQVQLMDFEAIYEERWPNWVAEQLEGNDV